MTPQNFLVKQMSRDITGKMVRRPCLTILPSDQSQIHNGRDFDILTKSDGVGSSDSASDR